MADRDWRTAGISAYELTNQRFIEERDEAVRAPALRCRHERIYADTGVCASCGWVVVTDGSEWS